MNATTKVALYRRVSTTNNGQDVDAQLEELHAVAQQRGWVVVGDYVDDGVSGAKESRPALDRLLADVAAGKVNLVAVTRLDRLGRSLQHLLRVLDQFAAHGCGFVSIKDAGIDSTTPQGKLLLHLLGAFAEFERSLIRERVVAGVRRAQAKGKKFGRPAREVDVVAVERLRRAGKSWRKIAQALKTPTRTVRRAFLRGTTPTGGRPL